MDIMYGIKLAVAASIPLILGLTLHEIAKGWTARKLGDRYTLRSYNPVDYIDKIGTLTIPLLVILITQSLALFGWCKPVAINIGNIKNRKDRIILYLSGSIANLLMIVFWTLIAVLSFMIERNVPSIASLPLWDMLALMAKAGIQLNAIFIVFSLFPLLPFDGGKIVEEFLPRNLAMSYRKIEPYSLYIMLFIVFFTPIIRIAVTYLEFFITLAIFTPIVGLLN